MIKCYFMTVQTIVMRRLIQSYNNKSGNREKPGDDEDQFSETETLDDFHLDSLETLMIGGYGHCTERILHGWNHYIAYSKRQELNLLRGILSQSP